MEWRNRDYSEPSHIHIPRPSRASVGPEQSPRPVFLDVCSMGDDDNDRCSLSGDSD